MAQDNSSSALSVSGAQELLEKLQGVTLPAELEEKKKEFLEALNQAVQSDASTSTPQVPPPRPSKNTPKETPPEPEEDDVYSDTLPPPPPQILEEEQDQEENYEITEGGSQAALQEDAEYELLPSEQPTDEEGELYSDIMTSPPTVPLPQVPTPPPTAECEIDYTQPVKVANIRGIIKQGWLDKHKRDGQITLLKHFQRRYCVLVKHALYYYQNIKDKCQKGQIILNGYQVIYPPKQVAGAKRLDHCFELNGPGKRKFQVIKFMASSKEEAKEWVNLLCDQLNQTLSRRQSERLSAMERKSAENDKDNSEDGSERGSLSGSLSGVEGVEGGPTSDDMYECLPDQEAISEDIYEFIPGDQQAPGASSSMPQLPKTPIPPTVSSIPTEPVPPLPTRPQAADTEQAVVEDDDGGDFYDDVAQPAIIEQIQQLKQQDEEQLQQDAQPKEQPEETPAPLPPRPPKQVENKPTEPEVEQPVKEEKQDNKVEENINPADVFVALWNCTADGEDELNFTRGEFIHIHKKLSDDWWIGVPMETKEFRIGLVPSAYLQEAYVY